MDNFVEHIYESYFDSNVSEIRLLDEVRLTYVIKINGHSFWYMNGKLHREDGPAVEWENGIKHWNFNGKLHREDGPAVEYANGRKEWWLNDKQFTEEEWNGKVK